MCSFVPSNLEEPSADVRSKASVREVGIVEERESLLVEDVLKELKVRSELQDGDIYSRR